MRKKSIDEKDIEIINILQRDATLTNKDLSEKVDLSQGPTLTRVKILFEKKVFIGYNALIDYNYFGYSINSYGIVTILGEGLDTFISKLLGIKNIIDVHLLTPQETNTEKTKTIAFLIMAKSIVEVESIMNEIKSIPDIIEFKFYKSEKIPNKAHLILDDKDVM